MVGASGAEARPLAPAERLAEATLGLSLTFIAVAWALDLPQAFGWTLYNEQIWSAGLALTLSLAFLVTSRGRRTRGWASPHDIGLALLSFALLAYIAADYPSFSTRYSIASLEGILVCGVYVMLLLEATRRCAGTALLVILLAFVAYALLGHALPGVLQSRPITPERLVLYLGIDTNAVIGKSLEVAVEVVVPFILFGQILLRGGGADFFNDLSLALFGRSRGGGGKIAVVSSLAFGFVSGSAVANVVSGGVVTIPLMMRQGMAGHQAAAVEAVASTGGQLVPPVMGASAFLMAEYLAIPYREVALAAVAPSLLFYLALYFWCDFAAGRQGLKPIDPRDLPRARDVLVAGWYFPVPFVLIFVALFWWSWPAQKAALLSCAALYLFAATLGYRGRRMTRRDIGWALTSTGPACIEVIVICAAAGIVIGVLNFTGLSFRLTLYLSQLASAHVLLLLAMTAVIGIVLGMGMPTVAVYVLLASLIGPAMIKAELDPVAAHMFLLYYGMLSMITPPVALASFTAASIARADFWRTGWEGVKIGWICFVIPFVFVFQPSTLFRGDWRIGLAELAFAVFGVVLGTAAVVGWMKNRLAPAWRGLAALAALGLFLPLDVFGSSLALNLAGAALGAVVVYADRRAPPGRAISAVRRSRR
jgi:TRAP transporter 4TM/12TM fusion protein